MGLRRFALIMALACVAVGSSASQAEVKIGFIDAQKILEQYRPYQDALKEYGRYEEELSREITKQENNLKEMAQKFKQQELLLSEKRKQEEAQAIQKKQMELERFVKEITDPMRGKLAQKQASLSEPIFRKVNEVVNKVAEGDGFDLVLKREALAYSKEDLDLTQKVLDALQKDLETQDQAGAGQR